MSLSEVIKYSDSARAKAVFQAAWMPMFVDGRMTRKTLFCLIASSKTSRFPPLSITNRRYGYLVRCSRYVIVLSVYACRRYDVINISIGVIIHDYVSDELYINVHQPA